jgi:DNA-binding MarR family transcriptional regulator
MAQGKQPSPLALLHRASQRADNLFAQHIGNGQLTPRQFAVLKAVSEADGLSQTAIMSATGIDRSTTAELVRRLVSGGLLQRRRTRRDARIYAVRITTRGRQALAAAEPAARATDAALLSLLPASRRAVFLEALASIAASPPGPASAKQTSGRPKPGRRRPQPRTHAPHALTLRSPRG